jgi:hypothetical protein
LTNWNEVNANVEKISKLEKELRDTKDLLMSFIMKCDLLTRETGQRFSEIESAISGIEKFIQESLRPSVSIDIPDFLKEEPQTIAELVAWRQTIKNASSEEKKQIIKHQLKRANQPLYDEPLLDLNLNVMQEPEVTIGSIGIDPEILAFNGLFTEFPS